MLARLLTGAVALYALAAAATALADDDKASHKGWPVITGKLWIASNAGEHYDANRHPPHHERNNELLGSHGDDTITGGSGEDVIWGDHLPYGPSDQHDVLNGGPNDDFIYGSHGYNVIDTGPGRDVVHIGYGRGKVTCGRPRDRVYVSHKSINRYHFYGCKRLLLHGGKRR